jgi:hypothetical protein
MSDASFIEEEYSHLYRSDASDTSIEAAEKLDATRLERMVLEAIQNFNSGCISDDVRKYCKAKYGVESYSSITARFCSLERKGLITYTGEKRLGASGRNQRVMIVNRNEGLKDNG